MPSYTPVISCPDKVGIVAAVSGFVAVRSSALLESSHHTDPEQNWFYMRIVGSAESLAVTLPRLREEFAPLADEPGMEWHVRGNKTMVFFS
jgi:formyltetrahydrofolate deformylase